MIALGETGCCVCVCGFSHWFVLYALFFVASLFLATSLWKCWKSILPCRTFPYVARNILPDKRVRKRKAHTTRASIIRTWVEDYIGLLPLMRSPTFFLLSHIVLITNIWDWVRVFCVLFWHFRQTAASYEWCQRQRARCTATTAFTDLSRANCTRKQHAKMNQKFANAITQSTAKQGYKCSAKDIDICVLCTNC